MKQQLKNRGYFGIGIESIVSYLIKVDRFKKSLGFFCIILYIVYINAEVKTINNKQKEINAISTACSSEKKIVPNPIIENKAPKK